MNHLEAYAEYRSYLFTLAYRMLGSVMDAEDLLQETFLRWQETSLSMIRSPKAFLATVVKHLCLNHLQSARVNREEGMDLAESFTDPGFDELLNESLSAALLVLLERLSPNERVVLLLREVFDYDYEDIATIVRNNTVSCRQMLRRAKLHLSVEHSRFSASPEQLEALVRQFTDTCATGDLDGLVSLLGSDFFLTEVATT
jgi:RNA polymerase sigma-70 factor (ECF subfamily)